MINQITGSNRGKLSEKNKNLNAFDYSSLIKIVRIIGLVALISYMAVILFTWIYADRAGYIYFSVGEPSSFIKYSEWILGFMAIFIAIYYLLMELSGYIGEGATKHNISDRKL